MALYYHIKESYRDVQGHTRSLILLNIRFKPSLTAVQVRRIAYAFTERFKTRSTPSLFKEHFDGLTPIEQAKAGEWWSRMEKEGGIDRFSKEEQELLRKYENYMDLETTNYTDTRDVDAEWLCRQTIDKLQLEGFLHKNGWAENTIHTALSALTVHTVYAVSGRSPYYYLLLSGKNKLKALYPSIHRCCSRSAYSWAWFSVLDCEHYKICYFDRESPIITK